MLSICYRWENFGFLLSEEYCIVRIKTEEARGLVLLIEVFRALMKCIISTIFFAHGFMEINEINLKF